MKRYFLFLLCLPLLFGTWHDIQAASVTITMNSVTNTMTLQDQNNEPVAEDTHTGN